MSLMQQIITIIAVILGTVITRFLPFYIFSPNKPTPRFVKYLGAILPPAIFSLLVVYSLRNIDITTYNYGFPELISILVIILLHLFKKNMLLSIAGGTICYMLCIQFIF